MINIKTKPDWITEIYEMGPNAIDCITSYERTGKPVRRFRITAGRVCTENGNGGYYTFFERQTEVLLNGHKVSVWEILSTVPVYHGETAEACLSSALVFLKPEEILD